MRVVLYQPDNPENFGRIVRLCVCLDAELHAIAPAGFPLDDARIRRGSLDYGEQLSMVFHASFSDFQACRQAMREEERGRLILLSTHAEKSLYEVSFRREDWLLFGQESAGVPPEVHQAADLRLRIPMQPSARSLNLSLAAAIVLGEGMRQLNLAIPTKRY